MVLAVSWLALVTIAVLLAPIWEPHDPPASAYERWAEIARSLGIIAILGVPSWALAAMSWWFLGRGMRKSTAGEG
jgi:hypothetical protein